MVGLILTLPSVASAQAPAGQTSSLPPAVLKAFKQAYPSATISTTTRQRNGERDLVHIDSLDNGRRRVVIYDSAGTVIELSEQVSEKELPGPVAAAMHSHPRATYGGGMKVTRNGSVEYHLTLLGTRKTAMVAKPDGTVVSFK
jgi:hypothetical protein